MARTEQQQERSRYRKDQRTLEHTHGGFHGRSLLEQITDELDRAVGRYMDLTEKGTQKEVLICRGEVRGLARALTIFAIPIYPSIKATEKAAVRRVKEKRDAEERATAEEERRNTEAQQPEE